MSRALRFFTNINTTKGTYNVTSHDKPGRPSMFLPARCQWRLMTSQRASHGRARLSRRSGWLGFTEIDTISSCAVAPGQSPGVQWSCSFMRCSGGEIRVHTPRHTRKNSSFSTQEEHVVLLGLEVLTEAPNLRYATRSMYAKATTGLQRLLRVYWVVHNFLRVHFTIREVPAVALGILERRLSVHEIFQIQMA